MEQFQSIIDALMRAYNFVRTFAGRIVDEAIAEVKRIFFIVTYQAVVSLADRIARQYNVA